MIAEGGRHVVVNAEPMRYIDFESLPQVLWKRGRKKSTDVNQDGKERDEEDIDERRKKKHRQK